MLIPAERFIDTPVMSLQTGSELARTAREIIDPFNLVIVAYELEGRMLDQVPSLLRIEDIREVGSMGIIIDSVDELISPGDMINIQKIYDYRFELNNKQVIDEDNRKVGKVVGYTLEAGNFVIQQLRIHRPLLRSFGDTELLIHRSQIVKITDEKITVKSSKVSHDIKEKIDPITKAYENPFRRPQQTNPETINR